MSHSIISLDGVVQRQGIKVSAADWLDMGSVSFSKTPDEVKAAAYQAAKAAGWKNAGLLKLMVDTWGPRVDEDTAKFTLELLKDLAILFPKEIEQVKEDKTTPPVFKIKGCEKTIPFPPQSD